MLFKEKLNSSEQFTNAKFSMASFDLKTQTINFELTVELSKAKILQPSSATSQSSSSQGSSQSNTQGNAQPNQTQPGGE